MPPPSKEAVTHSVAFFTTSGETKPRAAQKVVRLAAESITIPNNFLLSKWLINTLTEPRAPLPENKAGASVASASCHIQQTAERYCRTRGGSEAQVGKTGRQVCSWHLDVCCHGDPQNIPTQHNEIFLIKFEGFDFTVWCASEKMWSEDVNSCVCVCVCECVSVSVCVWGIVQPEKFQHLMFPVCVSTKV